MKIKYKKQILFKKRTPIHRLYHYMSDFLNLQTKLIIFNYLKPHIILTLHKSEKKSRPLAFKIFFFEQRNDIMGGEAGRKNFLIFVTLHRFATFSSQMSSILINYNHHNKKYFQTPSFDHLLDLCSETI